MKQKGMAILMTVLLAAGAMAPVYAAEEIFSIEAVYVGESQKNSPHSPHSPPPSPKPEQQRKEKPVSQPQQPQQPQKKKIKVVPVSVEKKGTAAQTSPEVQSEVENTIGQTSQDTDEFPYTLESFAEEVLRLTNEARAEAGAPALELDPTLQEMAQARKDENKGKMTHTRPDGTTADAIFKEYDTNLKCTGEIIIGVCSSPGAVVNGFLASKAHRENMLNPDHMYVGIGASWGETPAGTGIAVLELFAK